MDRTSNYLSSEKDLNVWSKRILLVPMTLRAVLFVSLGANLLFVALLAFRGVNSSAPQQALPAVSSSGPARPGAPGNKITRIDWQTVESSDYKDYIQNLRAIGCPEETIFDIIVADVNTLYAMKSRSLTPAKEWKYWEAEDEIPSREEIRNQKLRHELEREKQALIAAILGPNALDQLKKYQLWGGENLVDRKLAFLPDGKRSELKNLEQKYFELEQAAMEWDSAGVMTEATMEKLAALTKQKRDEIESLLTPQELQDFDLRISETANRLRRELAGFHPTEQEFKLLFQLRKAREDHLNAHVDVREPGVIDARISTELKLKEKAVSELGPQRYEEFERSQDMDYQNTLRMARYFGLPDAAANDVHELKRRDQRLADELSAAAHVTDEERNAAFSEMEANAERRLRELLGDRVFDEYRRNNRWWIRSD